MYICISISISISFHRFAWFQKPLQNTKTVKEELLKSLKESETVAESDFDVKNIVDQREAINKIKHYDEIIKTGNKNTIRYKPIQGHMLKKFRDTEEFVENVKLS